MPEVDQRNLDPIPGLPYRFTFKIISLKRDRNGIRRKNQHGNGIRANKDWDPMGSATIANTRNGIHQFSQCSRAPRRKNFRPGDEDFDMFRRPARVSGVRWMITGVHNHERYLATACQIHSAGCPKAMMILIHEVCKMRCRMQLNMWIRSVEFWPCLPRHVRPHSKLLSRPSAGHILVRMGAPAVRGARMDATACAHT